MIFRLVLHSNGESLVTAYGGVSLLNLVRSHMPGADSHDIVDDEVGIIPSYKIIVGERFALSCPEFQTKCRADVTVYGKLDTFAVYMARTFYDGIHVTVELDHASILEAWAGEGYPKDWHVDSGGQDG